MLLFLFRAKVQRLGGRVKERLCDGVCGCLPHPFIGEGHRLRHAVQGPLKPPGPKGPASPRPANGGRFSPAGAGTGLWDF